MGNNLLTLRLPAGDVRTRYVLETIFGSEAELSIRYVEEPRPDVAFIWNGNEAVLRLHPATEGLNALDALLALAPEKVDSLDLFGPQCEYQRRYMLSAMFHVLAGTEEVESDARDDHERFAASYSRLFRSGYDVVPFVDLWADLMVRHIRDGDLAFSMARRPVVTVSHDVDAPYRYRFQSATRMLRGAVKSLVSGDFRDGLTAPFAWSKARLGVTAGDPYDHFGWMMQQAEEQGLCATFYIIAGHSGGALDGDYDVFDPDMMTLWEQILCRGHRIGVHPSYGSFRSVEILKAERSRVLEVHDRLRRPVDDIPVRMHYLRFDPLVTPRYLEDAGFRHDSTLGFADRSGFRRGTCRPFRLWDHVTSQPLRLIEHPLLIMDATLLARRYEGLDKPGVSRKIAMIAQQCDRFGGELTLLWHNNYFTKAWHFDAYRFALLAIGRRPVGSGSMTVA